MNPKVVVNPCPSQEVEHTGASKVKSAAGLYTPNVLIEEGYEQTEVQVACSYRFVSKLTLLDIFDIL